MKKREIDMINGPLVSGIMRFALPVIATGVLQILYNAADIVIVGQFSGPESTAVAAIGSTTALIHLILSLFLGLSIGTNAALAMSLGRKDDKGSSEVVHTAISIAVISGLFMLAVGVLCSRQFLKWMLSPEELLEQSTLYLRIYSLGMPASMLFNFASAILIAKGDTKRPLYYLMSSGIINVLLNLFFVAVCGLDVAGVALATIISQYISAVLVIQRLVRLNDCCKLSIKRLRLYKDKAVLILQYGIPAGATSVMFNISNVFIQSSLNSFGNVDMNTGSAASASIEGLTYTSMNAFNQTAITFVGQNMGAKNHKRINKIYALCTLICVLTGIVMGWGMYASGELLLKLYSPDASGMAIEYGLTRMSCILTTYFICGILEVQMGTLRGMGYATVPAIMSITGICAFRIVWIYTVFEKIHTMQALYMCYPAIWIFTVLIMGIAYIVITKKILPKRGINI